MQAPRSQIRSPLQSVSLVQPVDPTFDAEGDEPLIPSVFSRQPECAIATKSMAAKDQPHVGLPAARRMGGLTRSSPSRKRMLPSTSEDCTLVLSNAVVTFIALARATSRETSRSP